MKHQNVETETPQMLLGVGEIKCGTQCILDNLQDRSPPILVMIAFAITRSFLLLFRSEQHSRINKRDVSNIRRSLNAFGHFDRCPGASNLCRFVTSMVMTYQSKPSANHSFGQLINESIDQ